MIRLRHGPITFTGCGHALAASFGPPRSSDGLCPHCVRHASTPKPIARPARKAAPSQLTPPSAPARYESRPKGVPVGTEKKLRQRRTPDELFVCDACYRGYRLNLPLDPTHPACNDRRLLRRSLMPLTV